MMKNSYRIGMAVMLLTAALLIVSGCQKKETVTRTDFALDTVVTITLYDQKDQNALNEAFTELRRLDALLSAYQPDSEISAVNAAAGQHPVLVSQETFEVIEKGLEYGALTDGAFDITIGPLADLWHISDNTTVPSPDAIEQAKALVNYKKVILDSETRGVFLEDPGMKLNLGAIAKGYIGDCLKIFLKNRDVTSGIINLGGNVVLIGEKGKGQPFGVSVEDPDKPENSLGVFSLSDCAAVTSGDYQRFFTGPDGKRYHHILNPQTGYPSESGLRQVTIVCDDSTRADILSTSCFILGEEKGRQLLKNVTDCEAVFVSQSHEVHYVGEGERAFRFNTDNTAYREIK